MKLYKFKSGSDRDINALLNEQLWVPTLNLMNDPMDIGFYININKIDAKEKFNETNIIAFQNALNRSVAVLSFSITIQNRRLWNYYSDGMKGFVLTYRSENLIKSIMNSEEKNRKDIVYRRMSYGSDKYDLSNDFNTFLKYGSIPVVSKDFKLLFCKDKSWEEEQEYRIALSIGKNNSENGFLIEIIRPYEVGVGYRMASENYNKIKDWCENKKITLRKFIPNFNNKKSNSNLKSELIVKGEIDVISSK